MQNQPDQRATLKTEHYPATLSIRALPHSVQSDAVTLWLFVLEILSIKTKIKTPIAGEIRIQWWRDCLNFAAPDVKSVPLASALQNVITTHEMNTKPWLTMCDAAVATLYPHPPETLNDFEGLAAELFGPLLQTLHLLVNTTRAQPSQLHPDAAGYASILLYMRYVLQTRAADIAASRIAIPQICLTNHATDIDTAIANPFANETQNAWQNCAEHALSYAPKLKSELHSIEKSARAVYLPARGAVPYIKKSAKSLMHHPERIYTPSPLKELWWALVA